MDIRWFIPEMDIRYDKYLTNTRIIVFIPKEVH